MTLNEITTIGTNATKIILFPIRYVKKKNKFCFQSTIKYFMKN